MGYPPNWQPRGTSDRNITQSCGGGHTAQAHAVSSIPTDTADSSPIARLNMTQYGQLLPFLDGEKFNNQIHLAGKATHPCLSATDWVVDSGAFDHMTATESHLSHIQQASMSLPVNLPNGSSLPISSIGQATLSPNIFLDKVFYIPGFTCNLLSISQITQQLNCVVMFFPTFCIFQDLTSRKLIGTGEMRNRIYYFKPLRPPFASPATRVLPRALWHQRLGHISFHRLSLIPNISMSSLNKSNECCDVCHRAKQARLSFPISNTRSDSPFILIHCDI